VLITKRAVPENMRSGSNSFIRRLGVNFVFTPSQCIEMIFCKCVNENFMKIGYYPGFYSSLHNKMGPNGGNFKTKYHCHNPTYNTN
jgi:hypothetical protein